MKRRTFMYLSIAAAAISIPSLFGFKPDETVKSILKKSVFLSQICDVSILREIGVAYKTMAPSEISSDQLVKLLLTDGRGRHLKSSDPNELTAFIDEQIMYDMSHGNTVIVNGWVISVTEARQCALFSIN